ncbi:MAG: ribosomal RNA small subunit methyltransferase A [Candidatus Moranbacteria bacterium]|jgi:16S rRNA (adenine1518-N6/adenine1519-N6)-dimethyltransferase|nr:ribosomal RNA small subunit methyltransferase A [Candidatus Moranbacteria bacterium]
MSPVKAKKSLGQNFLQDEEIIERIFSVADVGRTDWVFEIGPGTGAVTFRLVPRVSRYVALEIDHDLATRLQSQFADSKKVTILKGNILDSHVAELLETAGYASHAYKVIANIPYYITAPIIRTLLSLPVPPQSLTLMVQEEVADRLTALPGAMSLVSVMAQYYADVTKKFVVPKTAFIPVPKVESAIIHLVPKRPYDAAADHRLFRLARAGFAARRKTLSNNLATSFSLPREVVTEKLQQLGMRTDIRAQALSVDDWIRLTTLWEDDHAGEAISN